MSRKLIPGALLLVVMLCQTASAQGQSWTVIPEGRLGLQVWQGQVHLMTMETKVLGPSWSNPSLTALAKSDAQKQRIFEQRVTFAEGRAAPKGQSPKDVALDFRCVTSQKDPETIVISTTTKSDKDADATGIGLFLSTGDWLAGGKGVATLKDGKTAEFTMPLGMSQIGKEVTDLMLTAASGQQMRLTFASPVVVNSDRGELRIWTLSERIPGGKEHTGQITIALPNAAMFEPDNRVVDMKDWYPIQNSNDFAAASEIGMESWLDKPAGKRGFLQIKDRDFVFADGTPVRFWGTNISFADSAPTNDIAEKWAAKFAKYGVNIVRMHKFIDTGWAGHMSDTDITKFHEEKSARFDRFHAELANRGVYVGWSPVFAPRLNAAMKDHLANYAEIDAAAKTRTGLFAKSLYPLSTIATDVQDFYIELTCLWLNRVNTVTNKRYADDPAVAYIELHNEADIFFAGTGNLLRQYPTYQKAMCGQFSQWLTAKYGGDEQLKKAWGNDLKKDETLAAGNVFPFPNWSGKPPASPRVADSYRFLYEHQTGFYTRYIKAIRDTGYKGPIVGGCWQAADMLGHLYNVASDREAGFIDRHNYFNGDRPMLARPGSALLSAGMQQVADRPFGMSEWGGGHVFGLECPAIIGLVGVGLQGWDLSAQFSSNGWPVRNDLQGGLNASCDQLYNIGQYPGIARILYSGALKEADVVATRRVSMEELAKGQVGFEERFSLLGGANLKSFSGSVPNEALGIGRVVLEYVDRPADKKVDMDRIAEFWDKDAKVLRSTTGQIRWDYSQRGFFTADTPAGAAIVGFSGGRKLELSTCIVQPASPFSAVYIVPRDPAKTLADTKAILVMVMARTADKGMVLEETSMAPLVRAAPTTAPREKQIEQMLKNPTLLVEPVNVTITLKRQQPCNVYALDHEGRRPANATAIPATKSEHGQTITLDGAKHRTMYYLVEFQ